MSGVMQHHHEDVGKILLAVQADLKALRTELAQTVTGEVGPGDAARKMMAVQHLVDKAEQDIRLKTEAVLHNALSEQYTTLPAIRDTRRTRQRTQSAGDMGGGTGGGIVSGRMSVKEQLAAKRQVEMMLHPGSQGARQFLQERFGVTAPAATHNKTRTGARQTGRLVPRKAASPTVVPASVRGDPHAPPPKLTQKDVARGMEELVNRGMIPKHVDLTPAFVKMPAPVLCGQVHMHPWQEQFVKQEPFTNALGFNLSGVRMDIAPRAEAMDLDKTRGGTTQSMSHEPQDTQAGTAVGGGGEGGGKTIPISVVQPATVGTALPASQQAGVGGEGATTPPRDTPRDYNALLDEFSLHQFIIRRGATLTNTPEFESYRRKHLAAWGPIQDIVHALERLLGRFNVPVAYVDGNRVALLAQLDFRQPTIDDLLECLVNLDQVLQLLQLPGGRYKGSGKEMHASTRLQAVYRGHLCRRGFRDSMYRFKAALTIQRLWKTVTTCRATARIVEQVIERRKQDFAEMAKRLKEEWPQLKRRRRVVVHVPSISREEAQRMSTEDFAIRQNSQMGRLTWISSSDVEVVYVAPFPLSPDVVQYYTKLLQIRGLEHPEEQFKIVHPENYDRFPAHFSLATTLLYSPRCLRRIANFCKGKESYIIPGVVGPEDVKLACHLQMPLFAPEPQIAAVYGSKSGSKRVFSLAEVNTPPGAYDLYSEHETLHSLARLIFERLDVAVWLLKIDDECGGRGHAWIDARGLQCHQALVRERERSMSLWLDPNKQQAAVNKVVEELVRAVPRRVEIGHKELFPSWEAYLETFVRVGGVIEAVPAGAVSSPSVNLVIDPSGEVQIQSTHDQIFSGSYQYVGAVFPQKCVNNAALRQAAMAVGRVCVDKGIIGHVQVDFVSFTDAENHQRLWAVDLNVGLSDTAVSFEVFRFITGGHYHSIENAFICEEGEVDASAHSHSADDSQESEDRGRAAVARRGYAVCDLLYHPNVATVQYNVFFNLCRLKGVHFDLQERVGTAFLLVDSFAGGVLSLLTVGRHAMGTLRLLAEGLDFIQLQLGVNRSNSEKFLPEGTFKAAVKEVKARLDVEVEKRRGDNVEKSKAKLAQMASEASFE